MNTLFSTTTALRLASTVLPGGIRVPALTDVMKPVRFCGNCRYWQGSASQRDQGTCNHPAILNLRLLNGSLPSSLRVNEVEMGLEDGRDCRTWRAK